MARMALNATAEAAMNILRKLLIFLPALAVMLMITAPPVEAGGSFGIHLRSSGFGVSVGFGDWSVYTLSWSDPYWSLNFNTTLAGYGEWVWVNGLGRVWRPWVSASWRPYTYGRWVRTGAGWTWVAYEPWGYVPHHYGSWAYSSFGWVWQPGYAYAGANVVWVRAGAYVGWYARPPYGWNHAAHGYRHGYHDGYRSGYGHGYGNGYDDGWKDARYATFVGWRDLGRDNIAHHAVTHTMATRNRGVDHTSAPTPNEVRQHGGRPVTETRLSRRTVSMEGREITVARPEGVARSIERHATDAVSEALAPAAIERRQPLVRSRSVSTSGTSVSRGAVSFSREARSPDRRQRQESSSSTGVRHSRAASGARIGTKSASSSAGRTSTPSTESDVRRSTRAAVSHPSASRGRAAEPRTAVAARTSSSTSTSAHGRTTERRRPAAEDRRNGGTSRPQTARSDASVSKRRDSESSHSTRTRQPRSAKRRQHQR